MDVSLGMENPDVIGTANPDAIWNGLKLATTIGTAMIAGVFFAFSTFIMNALARLTPSNGIASMQAINITVINPLFMLVFMGTALACIVLAVMTLLRLQQPGAIFVLLGCVFYIFGTMLVTIFLNVPLNDALAKLNPSNSEAAKFWATYLKDWTTWNHLRGVAAFLAAVFLLVGYKVI